MGTARFHEGVRQMRFEGLLDRQTRGEITQEEAATVLGVSVRTFQRWAERYEEDGRRWPQGRPAEPPLSQACGAGGVGTDAVSVP